MNSFSEAIRFLYALQKGGIKFGLRGIRALLRSAGNPHREIRCIHVAGTNGKGSTASMIASVLTAAGYKTGLYTSPHLVSFAERIRINGRPISRRAITDLTTRLKPRITKIGATFFEATTALAFKYFAENKIDIAVIETGLGGRLDATNVVTPLASVITNISLEHTEILGRTEREIAFEKAGIIKAGVPCITGVDSPGAWRVIRKVCKSKSAPLLHTKSVRFRVRESSLNGFVTDVSLKGKKYADLNISLCGAYQLGNAAAALLTLRAVSDGTFSIPETAVRRGFSQIQKFSGISSRLSVFSRRPFILTDVAHNPAAMKSLARSLIDLGVKDAVLVFGVMKDKDQRRMIREIIPVVSGVVVVTPSTDRARSSLELVKEFEDKGIEVLNGGTVPAGVRKALRLADRERPVLITGSHFVVAEAIAFLSSKKYLTINQ